MVGPRVAAAAAQAALATLTQKDPGPRLAATTAIAMEPPRGPPSSSVQQLDRFSFSLVLSDALHLHSCK